MCLRRPSWLEKKACESFVTVAGRSCLLYVLRKPCTEKTLGQKCWPDVNGTVVTDRMLFYNGCNIAAEQMIDCRGMVFFLDNRCLLIFHAMTGCISRQIILTHYKYDIWKEGNVNLVVSVHIAPFDSIYKIKCCISK